MTSPKNSGNKLTDELVVTALKSRGTVSNWTSGLATTHVDGFL